MSADSINNEPLVALLQDCAQRNHLAFERLYRLSSGKLYAICRHMLRREALAEEALQETFVQIWRDAEKFDPTRALPITWMAAIARHRCLDILRKRRDTFSLPDDSGDEGGEELVDEDPGPLEYATLLSDKQALGHCMQTLPERQREAIAMAFYRGLTHQQLSAALSMPVGTVKSWIRRGLQRLRQCLQS